MKGLLTRTTDGGVMATLRDKWGYVHTLTGVRVADGYEIEVKLTHIPADLWVPGDEESFEVLSK